MKRVLVVFGTRPEAIKLAPLIAELKSRAGIETRVCVTAQHREMLDQVLELFQVEPDFDLNLMSADQTLEQLTADIIVRVTDTLKQVEPDLVIVQGDTTSAMAASLAAFYQKVPVAHVEAGLRTGDLMAPWPEEANRKLVSVLADYHFAPTKQAQANLLAEGINKAAVYMTGNTVIDALLQIRQRYESDDELLCGLRKELQLPDQAREFVLITGHRRENFGGGFQQICDAIAALAEQFPEIDFVYPVHLNPNVKGPVTTKLGNIANVKLLEPLDYLPFVYLLDKTLMVLTDSGGIQEEAPSFGKPILVMREVTERPEAIEAGTARLVGASTENIVAAVSELMTNKDSYQAMSQVSNPFGDGNAAQRIADVIEAAG